MIHFNPFAPVFLMFSGIVVVGLILPEPMREKWRMRIDRFEACTRWPIWVGAGMLFYGLTRWFAIW
jgi:hypothetical protein